MKKGLLSLQIFAILMIPTTTLFAQSVGISNVVITPDASSIFEARATNKGVLIPRVALTITSSNAPIGAGIATSLLVYNTATVNDVTPGYYYWNGSAWLRFFTGAQSTDWTLLGNAGTNPALNFIGTTDAQPFIIKTGVGGVERARILSGGNVLFNRTTALWATDLFEAQGNATFPDAINGYTDQGVGSGVYGENTAAAGAAIIGFNSAATSGNNGAGVYGQSAQTNSGGVYGNGTTFTRGVLGMNTSAAYAAIHAQNGSLDGDALVAFNSAANGAGLGSAVFASSTQTGGATIMAFLQGAVFFPNSGVSANAGSAASIGVLGSTESNTGSGLWGLNRAVAGAGTGDGIWGRTFQNNGIGVIGQNANVTGTGILGAGNNLGGNYLVGGSGGAFSGTGVGTVSWATSGTGTGISASGNNLGITTLINGSGGAFSGTGIALAAWATTAGTGTGVAAGGNNLGISILAAGSGAAFTGLTTGLFAYSTTAGIGEAVYSNQFGTICRLNHWNGVTQYKVLGTGVVSTTVEDLNGDRVVLHAPETPEYYFMDYGQGQLVDGKAHIEIDPILAKNILISNEHPLRVFVQLEGDCNGVYITNKTPIGFDVVELNGGTSDVIFQWNIVCNVADEELPSGRISRNSDLRFEPAPQSRESIEQETKVNSQKFREYKDDGGINISNRSVLDSDYMIKKEKIGKR